MTQDEFDNWYKAMSDEGREMADAVIARLKETHGDWITENTFFRRLIVNQWSEGWKRHSGW